MHFHEGYIDSASEGPFDAAACILTLHFLAEAERLGLTTVRLAPGGTIVLVAAGAFVVASLVTGRRRGAGALLHPPH